MARIRNIKPETFDDPDLNALPPLARWLFVGLWTLADRDGRLEDDPRRLKVRLLPYDGADCDQLLDVLAGKFITRYAVDGRRYLQVNNLAKHQRFHKDERAGVHPPPPEVRAGKKTGKPGNFPAKSPEIGDGDGDGNLRTETEAPPALDDDFATFQSAYPHGPNVGTFKHAAKVWKRLTADQRSAALGALPAYAASEGATKEGGRYVPTPQKWLSDEWWLKPITATARPSRLPTQADAYGWCDCEVRCGTRAGHELKMAREARAVSA